MKTQEYFELATAKKNSEKILEAYQQAKKCFFSDDQKGAYKYLYVLLKEYEASGEELPQSIEKLLQAVLLKDAKETFVASKTD